MVRAKKGRGRVTDPLGPLRTHEVVEPGQVKPKRKRKKTSGQAEAKEQKRWVVWARKRGLEFAHINNGANSKARRIHLHQMGCTAGAADILVFDLLRAWPEIRGLALEFKSAGGVQGREQGMWQKRIERLGWVYHVVRSAEEAREVCEGYGL